MTDGELQAYRILATQGIQGFMRAANESWRATNMLNRWIETGMVRVVAVDPGKPSKPVRLMNKEELATWSAHKRACFDATKYVTTVDVE